HLVALVREGAPGLAVVGGHRVRAVDYLPVRYELVARVVERAQRDVELVTVLRLGVLAHDGLAAGAQVGVHGHAPTLCGLVRAVTRRAVRRSRGPPLYSPR